jgi:hypothetical protein
MVAQIGHKLSRKSFNSAAADFGYGSEVNLCNGIGLSPSPNVVGGNNQSTGCATTQEEKFKYPHSVISLSRLGCFQR